MTTRIYVVDDDKDFDGEYPFLVRASTPAQAIRHVTKGRFKVEVASQERLVALVAHGRRVLDAGADEEGDA